MSFADTMRILSNINCGLASTINFAEQRQQGVPRGVASMNLFGNLVNGISRNQVAYEMQLHDNPTGNLINMYSGYGNPVSNTIGTLGMMGACTPWMYFNTCQNFYNPMPMMGGGFYSGMGMGFTPMMGGPGCCRSFWC